LLAARARCWLVISFCLAGPVLGSGCGLTEYEERLEVQQKRLKYMEQENKNLTDRPVVLSDRVEGIQNKYFFLRLPAGIAVEPAELPPVQRLGRLEIYPALKQDAGFQDVLIALAVEEDREKDKEKFLKDVFNRLKISGSPKTKQIPPRPFDKPLRYDVYQGSNLQLYVPQNSKYLTAIAFRLTGSGNTAAIEERINFCLASLLEGKSAEAPRKLLQAQSRKKSKEKKADKGD